MDHVMQNNMPAFQPVMQHKVYSNHESVYVDTPIPENRIY